MSYLIRKKMVSPKKVTQLTTQLKCLYTNVHNMGNKQKLEALAGAAVELQPS